MPGRGGFASSSKLLQKKWEERRLHAHTQKVKAVRSGVDNAPPKQYPHLSMRLKKVQKEEDRQSEIEHENQLLLEKMSNIMRTRGRVDNWNDYHSPSGNHAHREREQWQIADENVGIAKRLDAVRPLYDVNDWEEDFNRHEHFLEMKARETKDYETTPRKRRGYEDYESDFEDDESTNAGSTRLPRIRSRDSSSEKGKVQKKDSASTKLPKITSTRSDDVGELSYSMPTGDPNAIADQDAKLLFKGSKQLVKPQDAVLKALIRRSHAQRMANQDKFKELYDLELASEMTNALGKDYQVLMNALVADKASQDTKAFNTAIHNNDCSTLVELLGGKPSSDMSSVNKAYAKEYDVSLEEDIEHIILDTDCQTLLKALLTGGRSTSDSVDKEQADADALEIHQAGQGKFSDEDGRFMAVLRTSSSAQTKATFQSYKKVSGGKNLSDSVKEDGCSKDFTKTIKSMDKSVNNGPAVYADRLHTLLKGGKEKELIELLLARSELDLPEVRMAYRKKHGDELANDIMSKLKRDSASLIAQVASKQAPGQKGKGKDSGPKRVNGMIIRPPPRRSPVRRPQDIGVADEPKDAPVPNAKAQQRGGREKERPAAGEARGKGTGTPRDRNSSQSEARGAQGGKRSQESQRSSQPGSKAGSQTGRGPQGGKGSQAGKGANDAQGRKGSQGDSEAQGRKGSQGGNEAQGRKGSQGGSEAQRRKGSQGTKGSQDKSAASSAAGASRERQKTTSSKGAKDKKPNDDEITRLHEAMKGFGTDEEPLIKILSGKNNAERQQLKGQYQDKYKKDLTEELKSELSGDLEELILALMMTPTEYDAYCLHEAMEGMGTNEAALIGILSTRTVKELKAVAARYKESYGAELDADLKGDTSGSFEELLLQLVKAQRGQGDAVDQDRAKEDAVNMCKGDEDKVLDAESDHFVMVMTRRNRAQLRATFEEYKNLTGHSIEEAIQKTMSGDAMDGYIGLVKAVEDPVEFYATRLHDAMSGMGTNDSQLIRIIVSRAESDLPAIKTCYQKLYKKTLEESIEADTSGDYKRLLLALVRRDKNAISLNGRRQPNSTQPAGERKQLMPTRPPGKPPANRRERPVKTLAIVNCDSVTIPSIDSKKEALVAGNELKEITRGNNVRAPRNEAIPRRNPEAGVKRNVEVAKPTKAVAGPTRSEKMRKAKNDVQPTGKKQTPAKEDKPVKLISKEELLVLPENYVETVHRAISCWKKDDTTVIELLLLKDNEGRQHLRKKYCEKYSKDLITVLKSKHKIVFDDIIEGLMMSPDEYDARCLHDVMGNLNTGCAVLTTIVSCRSAQELEAIQKKYKELYDKELSDDLRGGTTNDDFLELLVALTQANRDHSLNVDMALARDDAHQLYKDADDALKPSNPTFQRILLTRNPEQTRETFSHYEDLIGHSLGESIRKASVEPTVKPTLIVLVSCLRDPVVFHADRLLKAMEGSETDDRTLIHLILSRTEVDLEQIKDTFLQLYGRSLADWIDAECSRDYKKLLLAVVEKTWPPPTVNGVMDAQQDDDDDATVSTRGQHRLLDIAEVGASYVEDVDDDLECGDGILNYKKVRSFSVSGEDDCFLGQTEIPKVDPARCHSHRDPALQGIVEDGQSAGPAPVAATAAAAVVTAAAVTAATAEDPNDASVEHNKVSSGEQDSTSDNQDATTTDEQKEERNKASPGEQKDEKDQSDADKQKEATGEEKKTTSDGNKKDEQKAATIDEETAATHQLNESATEQPKEVTTVEQKELTHDGLTASTSDEQKEAATEENEATPEKKGATVEEQQKEETTQEQNEDTTIEQKEAKFGEQMKATTKEQKEAKTEEQKEATTVEQKEVTTEEQKEDTTEEQKEVTTEEQKEAATEEQKEVTAEEQKEAITEEDEAIAEEQKECITKEQKEATTETQKEAVTEEQEEVITEAEEQKEVIIEEQKEDTTEEKKEGDTEEQKEVATEEQKEVITEEQKEDTTEDQEEAASEEQKEVITEEHKEDTTEEQKEGATVEQKEAGTKEQEEVITEEQKGNTTEEQKEDTTEDQKEAPCDEQKVITEEQKEDTTEEQKEVITEAEAQKEVITEEQKEDTTEEHKEGDTEEPNEAASEEQKEGITEEQEEDTTEGQKEVLAEEQKEDTTDDQKEAASEEQIEVITEEQKEDTTEEQKEDTTEEQKEDTTEEQKEVITEEQKEDTTEEQKEDTTEEQKESACEEQKEDITEEHKEDTTEEQKEGATEERKEVITEEQKENTTEEQKEDTTEDQKKASSEEQKEVITEEQKEDTTEEQKEVITEEQKEVITEEQKEVITEEQKEVITEEQKEDTTEEQKEDTTEDQEEAACEEQKDVITEEHKEETTEEQKEAITEEQKEDTTEDQEEATCEEQKAVITDEHREDTTAEQKEDTTEEQKKDSTEQKEDTTEKQKEDTPKKQKEDSTEEEKEVTTKAQELVTTEEPTEVTTEEMKEVTTEQQKEVAIETQTEDTPEKPKEDGTEEEKEATTEEHKEVITEKQKEDTIEERKDATPEAQEAVTTEEEEVTTEEQKVATIDGNTAAADEQQEVTADEQKEAMQNDASMDEIKRAEETTETDNEETLPQRQDATCNEKDVNHKGPEDVTDNEQKDLTDNEQKDVTDIENEDQTSNNKTEATDSEQTKGTDKQKEPNNNDPKEIIEAEKVSKVIQDQEEATDGDQKETTNDVVGEKDDDTINVQLHAATENTNDKKDSAIDDEKDAPPNDKDNKLNSDSLVDDVFHGEGVINSQNEDDSTRQSVSEPAELCDACTNTDGSLPKPSGQGLLTADVASETESMEDREYSSGARDERLADTVSSLDDNISYEDTDVGKYDELDLREDIAEILMNDSGQSATDHAVLPSVVGIGQTTV